ncbi:MAG: hypothetical protein QM773_01415 [Hyphomonadaceae bacterium]
MTASGSTVTVHMAASLDGFVALLDGRTGWMETSVRHEGGERLDDEYVRDFLKYIVWVGRPANPKGAMKIACF